MDRCNSILTYLPACVLLPPEDQAQSIIPSNTTLSSFYYLLKSLHFPLPLVLSLRKSPWYSKALHSNQFIFSTTFQDKSINYQSWKNGIRNLEQILKNVFLTYYDSLIFILYTDIFFYAAPSQQDRICHGVIHSRSSRLVQQCVMQGSREHKRDPEAPSGFQRKWGGWDQRPHSLSGEATSKFSCLWFPLHNRGDGNFPQVTGSSRAGLLVPPSPKFYIHAQCQSRVAGTICLSLHW